MQGEISMDLSFCQSENGFFLDELVTKLADVYERKAFAELLGKFKMSFWRVSYSGRGATFSPLQSLMIVPE